MNKIQPDSCILITGAGGGLGYAIVSNLKQKGFNNLLTPSHQELNLLNSIEVSKYFSEHKPVVVLHLASIVFGLQGNLDNKMRSLLDNTQINNNLFSAINLYPVEYVFFAGTVASYAYPYVTIPLNESDFFNGLPHSGEFGYAMSKRLAYAYLQLLADTKGVKFTYGIFTNLYGEYDRFNEHSGHVIPSLISKAYQANQTGGQLSVWGDGSAQRDFLHFNDAAEAVSLCMMSDIQLPLVNISSGKATSIGMLTELIAMTAGLKGVEYLIDKPVGIQSRVVGNDLITSIGFKQSIDLAQGISNLYHWYSVNEGRVRI